MDHELRAVVGAVARAVVERDWALRGETAVDSELERLMTQYGAHSVEELGAIVQSRFIAQQNPTTGTVDAEATRERLDRLETARRASRERQFQAQARINLLVEREEALVDLEGQHDPRLEKLIEKNIIMASFVTDLIGAMGKVDPSAMEGLRDIVLDCGDYVMYD